MRRREQVPEISTFRSSRAPTSIKASNVREFFTVRVRNGYIDTPKQYINYLQVYENIMHNIGQSNTKHNVNFRNIDELLRYPHLCPNLYSATYYNLYDLYNLSVLKALRPVKLYFIFCNDLVS